MNLTEKLEYCEQCKKRDFSSKSGLIYSLTKEKPVFESTCQDFEADKRIQKVVEMREEERKNNYETKDPGILESMGIKNSTLIGIITMLGATVWFFVGYFKMNTIFFYPPVLFVIGLIKLIQGLNQGSKKVQVKIAKKKSEKSDLLDDL